MECPNCTFQNLPGTKSCVRCRGLLDFSGVAIEPPRAAHGRLTRRTQGAVTAAGFRVRDTASGALRAVRLPPRMGLSWAHLAWSLVPGLAQIRRGQRALGWIILSVWALILLLAGLAIGTVACTFLCLTAISVHSLAVSLVLSEPLRRLPIFRRAVVGLALYGALMFGLYRPAALLGGCVFRVLPVQGMYSTPVVAEGDSLLYSGRWARPAEFHRGDLVVFEVPALGYTGVVIRAGVGVDRIVGLPGDVVRTDGQNLWVNDVQLQGDAMPLRGLKGMPPLQLIAGPDEYIVLPSALRWQAHGRGADAVTKQMISDVARVTRAEVLGRVFWRVRPLGRFGPM